MVILALSLNDCFSRELYEITELANIYVLFNEITIACIHYYTLYTVLFCILWNF